MFKPHSGQQGQAIIGTVGRKRNGVNSVCSGSNLVTGLGHM